MTQPTNPYDGATSGSDSTTTGLSLNPYGATSSPDPSLSSGASYNVGHSTPYEQQAPYGQQPYGQQSYNQAPQNGSMYQQYSHPASPQQTSGLAVGALISGISAWTVLPVFGAVVAIILGHLALSDIKKFDKEGRGLAIGGLAMGYVQFALGILFVLIMILGVFGPIFWAVSSSTY